MGDEARKIGNRVHGNDTMSSVAAQIEAAILKGKKSFLQGNSTKSLVRFELEEDSTRTVVIAEDIAWRRRHDAMGNAIGHYRVVTHYIMDTSHEPKRWINLDGNHDVSKH